MTHPHTLRGLTFHKFLTIDLLTGSELEKQTFEFKRLETSLRIKKKYDIVPRSWPWQGNVRNKDLNDLINYQKQLKLN